VSYEASVVDSDIMSEHSLVPPSTKAKKIVMGRSRVGGAPTPSSWRPQVQGAQGTASPFRGAQRFLTLNLGAGGQEGNLDLARKQVEEQTRKIMSKLRTSSVPSVPAPGSPRPKGYPGSPAPQGKENRAQSNSPVRATPPRAPLTPLRQQTRPAASPIPLLEWASPVVAAAGMQRAALDSPCTDLRRAAGGGPRFVTSTCQRPVVAQARVTPPSRKAPVPVKKPPVANKKLSVSVAKLKPSQMAAAAWAEGALVDEVVEEAEEVQEPFPSLERTDSDNFYPTPQVFRRPAAVPRRRNRAELEEEAEQEEPTKARRQSHRDSDLGFGPPPPKAPAPSLAKPPGKAKATPKPVASRAPPARATPQVAKPTTTTEGGAEEEVTFNFAMPAAPVPRRKVSKEREKETEGGEKRNYMDLWMPIIKKNKLYIEGNKLDPDTGAYFEERWFTSNIVRRVSDKVVATKKGTLYVLEGDLKVRASEMREHAAPMPEFVAHNFRQGFPGNWAQLVASWVAWLGRQVSATPQGGRSTGIIFNSTRLLATPHQGPPSNLTMSSVTSATAAMEGSRFLTMVRTTVGGNSCLACPSCQSMLVAPPETTARELEAMVAQPETTVRELQAIAEEDGEDARPSSLSRVSPSKGRKGSRSQEGREGKGSSRSKEGRKGSSSQEGRGSKARAPGQEEAREGSSDESPAKQVEHRSRSKGVKVTRNSMSFLETTMSKQEVTKLRAKDYPGVKITQGKKKYTCMFCNFEVALFAGLKTHISEEHQAEEGAPVPTPKKAGRRSQSAESVLAPGRRSRGVEGEAEQVVEEPGLPSCVTEGMRGRRKEFHCGPCNYRTGRAPMAKHCQTKGHKERERVRKRKSTASLSHSPRKAPRQEERRNIAEHLANSPAQKATKSRLPDKSKSPQRKPTASAGLERRSQSPPKTISSKNIPKHAPSKSPQSKRRSQSPSENTGSKNMSQKMPSKSPKGKRRSQSPSKNKISKSISSKAPSKRRSQSPSKNTGSTSKVPSRSPQRRKRSHSPSQNTVSQSRSERPRTPGLRRYSCFLCNFSTDEEASARAHLAAPGHARRARQAEEEGEDMAALHCDLCRADAADRKTFIKHLDSHKHQRRVEQVEGREEGGEGVNESRYGRKRKVNKNLMSRKSCVYDTPEMEENEETPVKKKKQKVKKLRKSIEKPQKSRKSIEITKKRAVKRKESTEEEEDVEMEVEEVVKSKPQQDTSLRRVVLDPAKVLAKPAPPPPKVTKSAEEILAKINVNPKTVKQRAANMEAMREFDEDHEDDLFGDKGSKANLVKKSTKTLLQDSDSEDEQDVTLCSAKTPVMGEFACFFSGIS